MINFDALPTERSDNNDFPLLPDGIYVATVKKAEVVTSKSGKQGLKVAFACIGDNGKESWVWDTHWDSEANLPQYKLGQFLRALPNTLSGTLTFNDVAKICVNKQMRVAVTTETPEGYKARNTININDPSMYYKIDTVEEPVPDDDLPFDMGDNEY